MTHLSIHQDQGVNTRPFKRTAVAALVALTLLVTTACAPEPAEAGPASTASAPEAVATPTEAPDPLEGLVSGDAISAEVAAELNASWGTQSDHRGYQLPSGEWVLLKGLEPLPANAYQAVHDAVVASIQWPLFRTSDAPSTDAAYALFYAALDQQEALTGRKITLALHTMSADPVRGDVPMWVAGMHMAQAYDGTREGAIAHAQEWVDVSPGVRVMLVIDGLA